MFILVRCINRVLHHTRGLDLSLLLRRFPPAKPGNQSYAPNTYQILATLPQRV